MFDSIPIYFKRIDKNVKVPKYNNETDAGMDIYSNETVYIHPQETILISTGLQIELPSTFELQIRPRSGLSYNTPLRIANSPATIDSGFRGELKIIVTNTSIKNENKKEYYNLKEKGNKQGIYLINKHDRIAQILLKRVEKMKFIEKEELTESERGEKGIGSSGI